MVLSCVLMTGLAGITLTIPWFGVFFAVCAISMMGMVSFQSSFYLNRIVDSSHRATVLSFRGLALNLGLGFASLLYTGLIATIKAAADQGLTAREIQETSFVSSLKAFPVYFILLLLVILVLGRFFMRNPERCFEAPSPGS